MKNLTILFAFALAFAVASNAELSAEQKEELQQFLGLVGECSKDYPNVSEERIQSVLRHKTPPENHDEQCLSSCVMTKSGLVTDNKINVDIWKKLCAVKWTNPTDAANAAEGAVFCYDKVQGDEPCKLANDVLVCIINKNHEMNVPPPDGF